MKKAIILIFFCVFIAQIDAKDSSISYKVIGSDSVLVDFYDHEYKLVHSFFGLKDSFKYEYEEDSPSFLYIFCNSNQIRENTIIVHKEEIKFTIENIDPVRLNFKNSELNKNYQIFLEEEEMINAKVSSLFKDIRNRSVKRTKQERDSLIQVYRTELKISNEKIVEHENEWIEKESSSYISIFLIDQSLKFMERPNMKVYHSLMGHINEDSLSKYQLYHKLIHLTSIDPLNEGDYFGINQKITDLNNIDVTTELGDSLNIPMFIFFYTRECRHLDKLVESVNIAIKAGEISKEMVCSINFEENLPKEIKKELQDQALFNCYFINAPSLDIYYELWMTHIPFGLIIDNGKIIRIGVKFEDFQSYILN